MKALLKQSVAIILCNLMVLLPIAEAGALRQQPPPPRSAQTLALRDYLQKSYLELFELAPKLEFGAGEIEAQRKGLESGKDICVDRFKNHSKQYGKQIDTARKDLKKNTATLNEGQRKEVHCNIQNLDLVKSEADILAGQAIPTAYDNLNAKLDVIQQWPAQYKQIQQELSSGTYHTRRWGDVKDIGVREIEPNQQDDIKRGAQAVEEMKRLGLMPPAVEDKAIQEYVRSVAERIAKKSDLKVPLHIEVLQSREINAFALPGGYLFIERGLLEAADDESQLAGVIAHEIAHDTARHSNKLMNRTTIASLFYQAAQIAAIVLTGGVAGIGMYYALQYGFYGLGLVLNLKLLGVSRDYELEADQLGVQYAWNAGYDPTGFIRFFDKMATKKGYVNSVSWFRTHPPFYQRMVQTQREIMYLEQKPNAIVQTSAFEQMKKDLVPVTAKAEKEEIGKPSLLITKEEGCEPPKKLEYKPDQPIEELCSSLPQLTGSASQQK
ncbi:MAG TPA: M48 family metalloprotease [Candidatus Acidoferrales bacterium]|nr:M48 family metalloprotease [Candidatus Acidoferrales bacterium]